MSCWDLCIRGSAFGRRTPQGLRCLLIGFLVLVIVFGEPWFWSSEVLAQDGQALHITVLDARSRFAEKGATSQFFVHDYRIAPVLGIEGPFHAPAFGPTGINDAGINRRTLKVDALGTAASGTARGLGGHGPFGVTLLALAQGDASSSPKATSPASGGSTSGVKKKNSKWIWIAVAAAGGAAALALTMKKSSATSSTESGSMTPTGPTITLGTPTVGAQ